MKIKRLILLFGLLLIVFLTTSCNGKTLINEVVNRYVEYDEHISIVKQEIPFIDLPTKVDDDITTYRFFLELSALEPITYTLLLPSEH